jgi:hypothetical protein
MTRLAGYLATRRSGGIAILFCVNCADLQELRTGGAARTATVGGARLAEARLQAGRYVVKRMLSGAVVVQALLRAMATQF